MSVTDLSAGRTLSKKAIASEFGIARDTVSRLLKDVPPCSMKNGYPVWRLADVSGPVSDYSRYGKYPGDQHDVSDMGAKERRDWFDSERIRLQVERDQGKLVGVEDVRAVLAHALKSVKAALIILPDRMEIDAGLKPQQVMHAETVCNKILNTMAEHLANTDLIKYDEAKDNE